MSDLFPHPSTPEDRSFAWRAADFAAGHDFVRRCTDEELQALEREALGPAAAAHAPNDPGPPPALPAACAALAHDLRSTVHQGRGFILLRGLPFERWGVNGSRWITWLLANTLGEPVTQTARGARLVDVQDTSRQEATPRQFSTSQELRLHTDPASDIIGLACVHAAASGGESVLSSAVSVHDEMLRQRPDLLALLHQGFHWHRFAEGRPQDGPFTRERVPVFSQDGGRIACRYVRTPIVGGQKEAGQPLGAAQIEALDLFDQIAQSPELRVCFRLGRGDMVWVNNIKVLHARTRFIDHPEPLPRRRLFRLWIAAPATAPRAPARMNYFNGGECGMPVTGAKAAYDMDSHWRDAASGGVARLGVSTEAGS